MEQLSLEKIAKLIKIVEKKLFKNILLNWNYYNLYNKIKEFKLK